MTDFVAIEQALLNLQADITAQQATVQALIDTVNSDKGAALGIATLNANSRLQPAQHPPLNSGQIYVGSAGNVPVTEGLLSAIASRSTNSANQPLVLDGSGLVSTSNIPGSIVTGASFRGVWNASTNSPTLTSSVGTNGHWYYVGTAGSTTLNEISSWQKGDIVIFNNGTTAWEKIDGNDAVVSVQAQGGTAKQGVVTLALTEFDLTTNSAIVGVNGKATEVLTLPASLIPAVLPQSSFNFINSVANSGFKLRSYTVNTSPMNFTIPGAFSGFISITEFNNNKMWSVVGSSTVGVIGSQGALYGSTNLSVAGTTATLTNVAVGNLIFLFGMGTGN